MGQGGKMNQIEPTILKEITLDIFAYDKSQRPCDIAKQISEMYDVNYNDIYNKIKHYIQRAKKKTMHPVTEEKRVVIQNQEPSAHKSVWDGTQTIKIAIMGDTQIGSKYTQWTHLKNFYDICEEEGITDVYHTGDITDGLKMRPGHEYELYEVSADDMLRDVVAHYPKKPGITTHFITGNHDASIYKQVGYDIGEAISRQRSDMKYLGRDCAVVYLTPNCKLELRHPWDGTAYALSYKTQKMVESMESDSKPNILAVGHYHKAEYMFYRNVHVLQTGCFQSQTPFTRGKGISVHLGGWIVTIKVDKDGTIKSIAPQFIPYYSSIKDDYNNRFTIHEAC